MTSRSKMPIFFEVRYFLCSECGQTGWLEIDDKREPIRLECFRCNKPYYWNCLRQELYDGVTQAKIPADFLVRLWPDSQVKKDTILYADFAKKYSNSFITP